MARPGALRCTGDPDASQTKQGVILVVTDEEKRESIFGFLRYPDEVVNEAGHIVAKTGIGNDWTLRDCMKTPDSHYREIVGRFAEAGYLKSASDDFALP